MSNTLLPFNIELLVLSEQDIKNVLPIKVLDIFTAATKQFHPQGLFSIDTFGKVGEDRRNRLFSYIDIHVDVFHPVIFKALGELKGLYVEIMSGKSYAIFDTEIKDFVKADAVTGQTGYSFFLSQYKNIKFEERPSIKREFNIRLVNKYRDNSLLNKLIVMPAGLRDFTLDENNRPSEDEINTLYREVLSVSSIVENVNLNINVDYLDSVRYNLQLKINAIYDYIVNLLEGKSKLILGKWASRKIINSTRNVITSFIPDAKELHGETMVSTNQTVVGLYQFMRAILPLAVNRVRDSYLPKVFPGPNSPAVLVNKKTLHKEMVILDPDYYDEWMTYEGLEKVMARYGEENLRHDYLEIDDHYIGLIYKGPDNTFKFVQDIDELPEGRDQKDLTPITFTELLYISLYRDSNTVPGFVTRYPITGYGSIYPSYTYLKTTVKSETREELNDNWELSGSKAVEFPLFGEQFFNSFSPSPAHLSRLGADFDWNCDSIIES